MTVTKITSMEDYDALLEKSKTTLVVIDFSASWCGPCRFIHPIYEKMAAENTDVTFAEVDVDEVEDVRRRSCLPVPRCIADTRQRVLSPLRRADSLFFSSFAMQVAARCSIRAMPTFHFYKNGEKVEEMMGADQTKLASLVTQLK
jgi:thiol-disulfide isomerase/thioredoxin